MFLSPLATWLLNKRETSWNTLQRWEWAHCVSAAAWFSAGVEAGGSDTKPGALLQQLRGDTVQSRRTGLRVGGCPPSRSSDRRASRPAGPFSPLGADLE